MRLHRSQQAAGSGQRAEATKALAGSCEQWAGETEALTARCVLPAASYEQGTIEVMARSVPAHVTSGVSARLAAFVVERFPFALPVVHRALESYAMPAGGIHVDPAARMEVFGAEFDHNRQRHLGTADVKDLPEATPRVSAEQRWIGAVAELIEACDDFLAREVITSSITTEEKLEIMRGMVLMRALDNRLKQVYLQSEVKYGNAGIQGKGFRSLGQEAIYGAGIRLRRGAAYGDVDGGWHGDMICPLIRDNALVLGMLLEPHTIRMILNAQMGKAGPPMDGKDIHVADISWGIFPPTAPLGVNPVNIAGVAMAFAREGTSRVAFCLIGEGGASLGEWHEAINACAARKLPAVFCLQNNQTALSTPVSEQSAVRVFADKAAGYGVPGITIDGTDPDAIAAAFTWAAERARSGLGPALIEVVSMRMAGHAHHDDMLYLGREPRLGWDYPAVADQQAYVDRDLYDYWSKKDPIATYAARLRSDGVIADSDLDAMKRDADALVEAEARAVIDAPWPEPESAATGVFANEAPRVRIDPLDGSSPSRSLVEADLQ